MEINERLDKIWERISDEDFGQTEALPMKSAIMCSSMSLYTSSWSEAR